MDNGDKALIIVAAIIGAVAGQHFWGIAGGVVGFFAGLGALGVGYALVDEVNMRLREHYRTI